MKSLVFDTSSIISIVTNDLLWVLKPLKDKFRGEFYIPSSVKKELIDNAMNTRMFKFEGIMINKSINDDNLVVYEQLNVEELLNRTNSMFTVGKKPIHILDRAEVEALVLTVRLQADAYVVDERTIRLLIEDPLALKELLERKLHTKVGMNKKLVDEFKKIVKGVKTIRSTELLVIAYEEGLLDKFVSLSSTETELLDGLLWGLKLRGCAISSDEIEELLKLEVHRRLNR